MALSNRIYFDQSVLYAVTMTTPVAQDAGPTMAAESLDAKEMAAIFKALGSPVRLRLLALMQAARDGGVCVCDLADHVGLSQSTVSHDLAVLVDAGLVCRERRGMWAWYALVSERVEVVRDLLSGGDSPIE